MVDWHKPTTILAERAAVINLAHVVSGIYIWEIITGFGFEYSIITKRRKFKWSFPLYLGCRWFPLLSITFQLLALDTSHEIDCQACVVVAFMFAYLSFMCASALIILRVTALWDRSKIVIPFACTVWIFNTAIYAYSLTILRSAWIGFCVILQTEFARFSILSTFTMDIILLVLMLTGLRRWKHAPESYGVWGLLYTQGFIWVIIVTLAEVPPTVFILLNLNDPLNLIFQPLGLMIAPLGAARLYRGLIDYPVSSGLTAVVNEPHDELVPPFSHQIYRTKQHGAERGSVVMDVLPAKTSGSEVPRGETFEGGIAI